MIPIHDHPAVTGRNCYRKPFNKLDLKKQIVVICQALGDQHQHREKVVSTKTRADRFSLVQLAFKQLKEGSYLLKGVQGLGGKHIEYLLTRWASEDLAPATLQTRISHLRWFSAAIGKAGLVRDPESYGISKSSVTRTEVATEDRSWSTKGVDFAKYLQGIEAEDDVVAAQLRLMKAFGLRLKESILFNPTAADKKSNALIQQGTKGGRDRVLEIRTQSQREALDNAKKIAARLGTGCLLRRGQNFRQAQNRAYYILAKAGITKAQLGVTSHGLRHEYANDLYQAQAGQLSPVRSGSRALDREADRQARKVVTAELGHNRIGVTSAYVGPMRRRKAHRLSNDAAGTPESLSRNQATDAGTGSKENGAADITF